MVKEPKKIKIVRIIARLNVGGPARHVIALTEGLNKDLYDSMLIYGSLDAGEGDMSYLFTDNDARSVYIPELKRKIDPSADMRAFLRIIRILKREKPDIVHTHTSKAGIIGRLAALFAGVPIKVHTFHGHIFYGYFNKWSTICFLWMERALAFFTDCIIAISPEQKDELLHRYGIGRERKYRVINLGLELESFSDLEKERGRFRGPHRFEDNDILVGIIGRLVPVKNHRMFIRVAQHLKGRISDELFKKIKFIIVGDGPERDVLQKYAVSQGVRDKIMFTGWVKDVKGIYADLDIVALTSRNEGTPLSLIEALASSKPIVATDVGGVRDAVGDASILVDKDDETRFVQCLLEFIQSPSKRREAGARGREYVMKKFLKERLIAQIERMYQGLLSGKEVMI